MTSIGICKIKSEYIIAEQKKELNLDLVSDKDKEKLFIHKDQHDDEEPAPKKQKLSKKEKKKLKGQNKSRGPTFRIERSQELCSSLISTLDGETPKCERKNCDFLHDASKYLELKPKDIGEHCYNYQISGKCSRGLACRFGSEHISSEGRNEVDEEKYAQFTSSGPPTKNHLEYNIQTALRKRTYNFDLSEALVKYNDLRKKGFKTEKHETNCEEIKVLSGTVTDEDIITLRKREKLQINWNDKLFLSPLTTVGNLPFRRICKEFGVDVTCGEMAMCSALLQGAPQEWALVKRHKSEDIFGVQLCANNPHLLTKCGQLLTNETEIDFIDLNLGCPIELVYKQGGGCGLLRRPKVLESCVQNLSDILPIPLTIKMRMGVYNNENVAHILAPKMRDCGASLITIHGRSREQRYTKSANWEYIKTVAEVAAPIPVLGNGDILTYQDYMKAKETVPQLAGVMIGRGALIKPWIFKEIKEQKLWDISSSERFDILKKYTNYGLEHWGSDNKGVENTRRFMLEWLSFLYRYVPVGLLECPPQKINERPPFYKGRDELETLMASPSASDWIKISEMLLGPVPENFHFLPKHKANSYD
ncbi:dihydrouridine synthase 3 [Leptinotarsa decemlineata]|uniref:dihydrouridine synthase 3 n=1 Tax=Leptinotarsa decemlineata TaxID=7539 RepID=UPI000C25337D|nr:tRNA-dihydrouridine(47) synthase [NAD(P)(+)]-like [Leptinotarsa decemlineata]